MAARRTEPSSSVFSRSAHMFAARQRARRWAAARPVLTGTLSLTLLAGLGWVALGSGALDVRAVHVEGATSLSGDDVRELAAAAKGDPMLTVDTEALQRQLVTVPAVASVEVSRAWPNALRIRVTERKPTFAVRGVGGWRLVDADGVAYTTVPQRPPSVLPLAVAVPAPDDPATRAALQVRQALPQRVHRRVVEIVAPTPAGVRLRLRGGAVVVWGGPEEGERKARALSVLLRHEATRAGGGTAQQYDVSTPGIVTTRS